MVDTRRCFLGTHRGSSPVDTDFGAEHFREEASPKLGSAGKELYPFVGWGDTSWFGGGRVTNAPIRYQKKNEPRRGGKPAPNNLSRIAGGVINETPEMRQKTAGLRLPSCEWDDGADVSWGGPLLKGGGPRRYRAR